MPKPRRTAREEIERAFHVSFKLPDQAAQLLDAYRDQVLAEGSALIRGRCPHHNDAPATYMTCHCVAADQLLAARTSQEG